MANIFKKVGDLAGTVADKTADGVVAVGKGAAKVGNEVAEKTVDGAVATGKATASFVKGE